MYSWITYTQCVKESKMFQEPELKDWSTEPEIVYRIIKSWENLSNDTEKRTKMNKELIIPGFDKFTW